MRTRDPYNCERCGELLKDDDNKSTDAYLFPTCERFADRVMTGLPCKAIQCDEIWSFVGCKAKNVHAESPNGWGDVWTWIAIDPDTKLIPAWFIGDRTAQSAYKFMRNLEPRLTERVQLSTDGHHAYLVAVKAAFLARTIDYGMLVKIYGDAQGEGKYSPNALTGIRREAVLCKLRLGLNSFLSSTFRSSVVGYFENSNA